MTNINKKAECMNAFMRESIKWGIPLTLVEISD